MPRRYTRADRAKALGIAVVKGQRAAADETGVPLSTIHDWWTTPEAEHLRTTAREQFVDQLYVGVQIGIAEVVKGLRSDAPLKDKAVATNMLAERLMLMRGEATSRTETRDITADMDDHERIALRELLRAAVEEPVRADGD